MVTSNGSSSERVAGARIQLDTPNITPLECYCTSDAAGRFALLAPLRRTSSGSQAAPSELSLVVHKSRFIQAQVTVPKGSQEQTIRLQRESKLHFSLLFKKGQNSKQFEIRLSANAN
jgi:hypothetical protein